MCSGMRRGSCRASCFSSIDALHGLHSKRQTCVPCCAEHTFLDKTQDSCEPQSRLARALRTANTSVMRKKVQGSNCSE